MDTNRFNLRNVVTIAICFAVFTVFMGCKKRDNIQEDLTQILDGWEISKSKFDFNIRPCDIFFVNHETGFIVGYDGNIYKTNDEGKSWQKQNSNTTLHLYSVFFTDKNNGFASGTAMVGCLDEDCDKGSPFLKTIDGGKTWEKTLFKDYTDIRNLHFFDNMNGLAIIHTSSVSSSEKRFIAKTSNGGADWELIDLDIHPTYNNKFYCFANIVYVTGESQKILKSKDYGNTWETIQAPSHVRNMYFYNEYIGYIDGTPNTYKTIDGGLNWEIVDFPFSSFETLHFYNETEGFNISSIYAYEGGDFPNYKGSISYQTYDGGATWKNSALANSHYFVLTYFVQKDLGYGINLSYFFTIKRK